MDYEKASDFEINKAIANIKWPDFVKYEQFGKLRVQDPDGDDFYFDFNNPSDAWSIIVENRTTINPYDDASQGWFATIDTSFFVDDKNPLRAAMIVYLMMQEAKC